MKLSHVIIVAVVIIINSWPTESPKNKKHSHFQGISFVKEPDLATRLKIFQNSVQMCNIQIYTRLLPRKDSTTTNDRGGFGITYHLWHLNTPWGSEGLMDHNIGYTCKTTLHYVHLSIKRPTVPSLISSQAPLAGKKGIHQTTHTWATSLSGQENLAEWSGSPYELLTVQGMPFEETGGWKLI